MNLSPDLVATVQRLIVQEQTEAVRAVDAKRVQLYWHIGQAIVEEEQHGADRAAYGSFLVQGLADALQPQFGSGFSRRQLYWYVQFYRAFPIVSALRTQFRRNSAGRTTPRLTTPAQLRPPRQTQFNSHPPQQPTTTAQTIVYGTPKGF